MDRIFGDRLVNHIVWKRTPARTGGDRIRSYGAVHDDILFYSKTDNYVFNPQYLPLDKENLDRLYTKDKDGRRYLLAALTGLGFRKNKLGNPWKGFEPNKSGRHWIFSISQLEAWDREGRIYFPKKEGSFPSYKRYLDEAEGQLVQDVWEDIKPVHLKAKESFGYPSQKPQALLERVVLASSNPGSLVLDPFCGSGTSIVVAHRLHRKWIGIDVSPTACNIMAARLRKLRPLALDTKIIGLPRNFDKPSDRK
jgi:site-specific DNA-methyltransferase (adenine-specific)